MYALFCYNIFFLIFEHLNLTTTFQGTHNNEAGQSHNDNEVGPSNIHINDNGNRTCNFTSCN